jgi:hypothetical protein
MTTKELYHHSMCSLISMTDDIPPDFFFGISFINKNNFFTYDDPNKEKMDTKFYKKWTSKRTQKNILNVLNDVDLNDCVYIENKNNYLIYEFEKCPDIQKNELINANFKILYKLKSLYA